MRNSVPLREKKDHNIIDGVNEVGSWGGPDGKDKNNNKLNPKYSKKGELYQTRRFPRDKRG